NTTILQSGQVTSWTCLEPDEQLAMRARDTLPKSTRLNVVVGTLETFEADQKFDTIIYIDVLEHIEDDRLELARAAGLLSPGGNLIVLAPAHQFLFSPFDRAIGHFRRYARRTLLACQPSTCALERILFLDSAGLIASALNRYLLRQSNPTVRQIKTWDRLLIPISRALDALLFHRVGKSILAIWTR